MPNEDKKPALKVVAIAASAVLVAALAATGIVAYGQNITGNMTMFGETNATDTTSSNMTDTASLNETDTAATEEETAEEPDKETFTASAEPNSECSSVITVDGAVSLNSTTTMTAEALSEDAETMTAGLNDTQIASLDQLIENACDAIRDGKSVTALGHLQTARDILSEASETETAEVGDQGEVEDEDEPGDIDIEDEEDKGFEE